MKASLFCTALLLSIGCSGDAGAPGAAIMDAASSESGDARPMPPDDATGGVGGMMAGEDSGPQPPVDRPCMDGDEAATEPFQSRASAVGADETLTDSCDGDGNLVEHTCERIEYATSVCGCAGECSPCIHQTGRVLSTTHDCKGNCSDGACPSWCPAMGDELTVTIDTSTATLDVENHTQDRHYLCSVHPDEAELCRTITRFLSTQVYQRDLPCYGSEPALLSLAWESSTEAYGCSVLCTEVEAP